MQCGEFGERLSVQAAMIFHVRLNSSLGVNMQHHHVVHRDRHNKKSKATLALCNDYSVVDTDGNHDATQKNDAREKPDMSLEALC